MTEDSMAMRIQAVHASLDRADIPHAFGGAIALAYHTFTPGQQVISTSISPYLVPMPKKSSEAYPLKSDGPVNAYASPRSRGVRLRWLRRGPLNLFFAKDEYYHIVDQRKVFNRFASGTIPVISATDLTAFKAGFNRPTDWLDISAMLQASTVDAQEALRWTEHIRGVEARLRLQHVIDGHHYALNDSRYPRDHQSGRPSLKPSQNGEIPPKPSTD